MSFVFETDPLGLPMGLLGWFVFFFLWGGPPSVGVMSIGMSLRVAEGMLSMSVCGDVLPTAELCLGTECVRKGHGKRRVSFVGVCAAC